MKLVHLVLLGAATAAPAAAQPIQFSAVLEGELGYGTNPFVFPGVTGGSIFGSGSFAPKLVYQTERSTTTLDGLYNRDQYFSHFGHTDEMYAGLERQDQLTAYLMSTLSARFSSSNRTVLANPEIINNEPLNIGQRTYRTTGQYQMQWQATARDQFSYGAQVEHLAYGRQRDETTQRFASSYTDLGFNFGYNRRLDARTLVGGQVSINTIRSKIYPDSRTIQPALTLKRQLSAIWSFDGHVGVVFQHVLGPFASSTTSLGYGLGLCGAYPRTRVCLSAERDTTGSGYGALRTISGIKVSYARDLTEHSHLTLDANYYRSSSNQFLVGTPLVLGDPGEAALLQTSRALFLKARYDRELTRRVSAGFGGGYQWRDTGLNGSGRAISATVHFTAKLGRL